MNKSFIGCITRAAALGLACLMMSGLLAGCGPKEPALPEELPPSAAEAIAQLEQREDGVAVEDPAVLQAIWADYLYPTSFTITNYRVAIPTFADISRRELTDYLRDRMYWNGDIEGLELDEYTPVDKLEAYCLRYFNDTLDFRGNRPDLWYHYDADTDRAGSGSLSFERREATAYNDIQSWPQTALDSVVRYPEGWLVAYLNSYAASNVPEDEFAVYKKFLLREREDGSLYIVGSTFEFAKTERLGITGESAPVAGFGADISPLMPGADVGTYLVKWHNTTDEVSYGLYDAIAGGDPAESYQFTADGSDTGRILYEGRLGDNFLVLSGGGMVLIDNRGQVTSNRELPDWMSTLFDGDPYGAISNTRFSPDLTLASLCADDGVRIYTIATGDYTLVPDTASTYDSNNIMSGTGYGTAEFVAGGTKLFCRRYGYESTVGFLLYDITTGERIYYDFGGGYGLTTQLSDAGCYIGNYYRGNEPGEPVYIDFATGAESPAAPLPNYMEMPYDLRVVPGGPGGYEAQLIPTDIPADTATYQNQKACRIVIRNNATGEVRDTGCVITTPSWAIDGILAGTQDGRVIVEVRYLGERVSVIVG